MILKILFVVLLAGIIAAVIGRTRVRARRHPAKEIPEINRHPERLEQSLDETDDA